MSNLVAADDELVESDDDILTEIKEEMEDDYEDNVLPTPAPLLSYDELIASVHTRGTLQVMVEKIDMEMLSRWYPKVDWNHKLKEALEKGMSSQKKTRGRPRRGQRAPSPVVQYSSDEGIVENSQRTLQKDAAELIAILEDPPEVSVLPKRRLVRPTRFSDYVVSKNPAVVHRKIVSSEENDRNKSLKNLDAKRIGVVKLKKEPLKDERNKIAPIQPRSTASLMEAKAVIFEGINDTKTTPGRRSTAVKRKAETMNGMLEPFPKREKSSLVKSLEERTRPEFQFLRKITGFVLVSNFLQLLDQLRQRELLETHVESLLIKNFSTLQIYELLRSSRVNEEENSKKSFTKIQMKFALTLYLYAPKCYRFLKTIFCLPSGKTLSHMVDSVKGNPGFFSEALHFLKDEILRTNARDYCIVIDSVPVLPQEAATSSGTVFGSRQICAALTKDGPSREAVIVAAVCLSGGPRLPIGLFAVDGEWGGLVAQIIELAVSKLSVRGARIWAIGMDGSARTMRILHHLGVNFHPSVAPDKCFFHHRESKSDVHIVFDTAHLLQRARFSQLLIKTDEGEVMWPLVSNLLPVARKICKGIDKDILLENLYMFHSVTRAVSQAIDFMRSTSGQTFALSQATCSFINCLNDLYDLTSVQTLFGSDLPVAITQNSYNNILLFINSVILSFKNVYLHYSKIVDHNNCTCNYEDKLTFLFGCHLTLNSLKSIIERLFKNSDLNVLYTNKFSLDTIDLMYSSICHERGTTKLLTLLQLKEGLMDILCQNLGEYTTYQLPAPTIVSFRSAKRWPRRMRHKGSISIESAGFMLRSNLFLGEYCLEGVNLACKVLVGELSSDLTCSECASMLRRDSPTEGQHDYSLLAWERCLLSLEGGVANPSDSLIRVVNRCEQRFRKVVASCTREKVFFTTLKDVMAEFLYSTNIPFREFGHRIVGFDFEPPHEYQLIRLICRKYLSIRMSSLHLLVR